MESTEIHVQMLAHITLCRLPHFLLGNKHWRATVANGSYLVPLRLYPCHCPLLVYQDYRQFARIVNPPRPCNSVHVCIWLCVSRNSLVFLNVLNNFVNTPIESFMDTANLWFVDRTCSKRVSVLWSEHGRRTWSRYSLFCSVRCTYLGLTYVFRPKAWVRQFLVKVDILERTETIYIYGFSLLTQAIQKNYKNQTLRILKI